MKYDFDKIIDRRNTDSVKWDAGMKSKGRDDLLPLWVADMDFALPEEILDMIDQRISHGIFGYTFAGKSYNDAIIGWFREKHSFEIDPEWICITHGVVNAVAMAVKAFTSEGDSILIQRPVYYPFGKKVLENNRKLVVSELEFNNGRYEMDFEDFEKKAADNNVKMFILSSPHNPVGRVWTKSELKRIGEICLKHDVLVFSDEIHCDLTMPGVTHTIFAGISEELADNCIIATAPSKTFNIAGLQNSNIIIPNEKLRGIFRAELSRSGIGSGNVIGMEACRIVYEHGDEWYKEMLSYISGNVEYVRSYLNKNIPKIKLIEPEGTYLIWLDCKELGLSDEELEAFITDKAKLWLDGGIMFGEHAGQFQRVNIACPRATVEEAMNRLKEACRDI